MLSDIQSGMRFNIGESALQARAASSVPTPEIASAAPAAQVSVPPVGIEVVQSTTLSARKPVDIKVDTEKLRANLQESLQKLNESLRDGGRSLNFQMDEQAGGIVVLVKNTDTGEVIRQIPNDAVVRIAKSIEALKGMLHNELT